MTAAPRRPSDVPGIGARTELLEQYWQHALAGLPATRDDMPDDEFVDHELAALAIGHAIAARLLAGRWCTVRDALRAGATVDQVAAAMDLDEDEVVAGLRSWADRQQRVHDREGRWGLTAAEADDVRALVAGEPDRGDVACVRQPACTGPGDGGPPA